MSRFLELNLYSIYSLAKTSRVVIGILAVPGSVALGVATFDPHARIIPFTFIFCPMETSARCTYLCTVGQVLMRRCCEGIQRAWRPKGDQLMPCK